MIDVIDAAKYIANTYQTKCKEPISEMKLHKLLYFAQRESLVRTEKPKHWGQVPMWSTFCQLSITNAE